MRYILLLLLLILPLSASADRLGSAAKRYKGVTYRYGGLSSRALDCSGLVLVALRKYGSIVPHKASQLYQMGKPIEKKNLKPDDLDFFSNHRHRISHVGIYLGSNLFIHASSGSKKVIISKLSDYSHHYAGARRL